MQDPKVEPMESEDSDGAESIDLLNFDFTLPPEAPTFYPSEDEFKDPLAYIEKIRYLAQDAGICKIIPPPDWKPPFSVDLKNFKFSARIQRIHELEAQTRIKLNFLDRIAKFWELQGTALRLPMVERKLLDLYNLSKAVKKEGGFDKVCKEKKWAKMARVLGIPNNRGVAAILRNHYEKILNPFDIFEARKGRVDKVEPEISELEQIARALDRAGTTIIPTNKRGSDDNELAKYICRTCFRGDKEDKMLLCDGCDDSYHTFCLNPPLKDIPLGDWRCIKCVAEVVGKPVDPFGFDHTIKEYDLIQFGEMANYFKSEYFNMPVHKVPLGMVEKEFWRILSCIDEDVTVEYGADLPGSGFPTKETLSKCDSKDLEILKYVDSNWNLNNIPVVEGSVLKYISADVSGMKVPWLYVGMCFATFCWHNEDHWTYSINYLHWGEPKTWYGIPGSYADNFEKVIKTEAPELFQNQPDLLHQLTTIMNPNVIMNAGIPVVRADQQAGEFIITFPRAYHAGFNQGFNFAEAVNFAPPDWLEIGRACIAHYSSIHRYCVFSHDELLCKIASDVENLDPRTAASAFIDMEHMIKLEMVLRKRLLDWGITDAKREAYELVQDDSRQCDYCKTTCYLSAVVCPCSDKLVCLHHFDLLCDCPAYEHILKYRFTMDELALMLRKLKVKSEMIEVWAKAAKGTVLNDIIIKTGS